MTEEIIRIIIEALMSGALIITLVTLRSTKKKAAEQAKSIEIDNDKNIMQNFLEYIVEPLKKEVNGLRKDVRKFTRAIEKINDCPHAADCPVRRELQNGQECPTDSPVATDRTEQ